MSGTFFNDFSLLSPWSPYPCHPLGPQICLGCIRGATLERDYGGGGRSRQEEKVKSEKEKVTRANRDRGRGLLAGGLRRWTIGEAAGRLLGRAGRNPLDWDHRGSHLHISHSASSVRVACCVGSFRRRRQNDPCCIAHFCSRLRSLSGGPARNL